MVKYEGNNTQVYQYIKDQEYDHDIFTVFINQSGNVNSKSHYTSISGELTLAYAECGAWYIQYGQYR